ncbi:helix-turn-helix domain-containing protein [Kordiimonas sp.]|uniref:helix-turn-helix domain-containing protein n=1 Tax=Kordiimonas sp. TaxID=1970157 RepID=UPI003A902803
MIRFFLRERISEKEFAEKRKITLDEVAAATGISKNTLSRIQSTFGYNTTTDNLNKLCAYLGCSLAELVEYIPDQPPSVESS